MVVVVVGTLTPIAHAGHRLAQYVLWRRCCRIGGVYAGQVREWWWCVCVGGGVESAGYSCARDCVEVEPAGCMQARLVRVGDMGKGMWWWNLQVTCVAVVCAGH